ncbi:hypothetical protein M2135_000036 [Parabacteroides sp. PF5-9]|nr:hypothetical protein [Parabacteroides sp. PF5-9]
MQIVPRGTQKTIYNRREKHYLFDLQLINDENK